MGEKCELLDMPNEIIIKIIKFVPHPASLFYVCRHLYTFAHHMSAADAYDLQIWCNTVLEYHLHQPYRQLLTAKNMSENFDTLYLAMQLAQHIKPILCFQPRIVRRWGIGLFCFPLFCCPFMELEERIMWLRLLNPPFWTPVSIIQI